MKKKQNPPEKDNHSVRKVIAFGLIVIVLIVNSLLIKLAFLVKDSTFNGKNRYSIGLSIAKNQVMVVSFDPESKTISSLKVSGKIAGKTPQQLAGVPIDATVALSEGAGFFEKPPPEIIATLFLNSKVKKTDITDVDIFRLWFFSKSIPPKDITEETIVVDENEAEIDKVSGQLFSDSMVIDENLSIEIINGADVPGLGRRLERIIKNMGGNVIAVSNSQDEKVSKIYFYEKTSYTQEKIQKFLHVGSQVTTQRGIADIKIIIGKDKAKTDLF